MSKGLENQLKQRKEWLASLLGEPVENVSLSKNAMPVEPDFHMCGGGRGEECCTFLTVGADGFECERFGRYHDYLKRKAMSGSDWVSKRIPEEPYPDCMIFPAKGE